LATSWSAAARIGRGNELQRLQGSIVRFISRTGAATATAVAMVLACVAALPAQALVIELQDVAADRIERQRSYAEGALPLPGTPDVGALPQRLASKGLKQGDAIFIRVFKAESELEIWMRKDERFVLLDVYPVCHWSGTIGPKIKEGDKQNPEGFYSVSQRLIHRSGRHPRSLNLGFPNSYDRALERTGSYILVHGGCSSIGCFAMTNPVMDEIFQLTEEALRAGQDRVHVHVFPFRMTEANLAAHEGSPWQDFWHELKVGYDAFEATHVPPRVGICDKRYVVEEAMPGEAGDQGPLAVCGALSAAAELNLPSLVPPPPSRPAALPRLVPNGLLSASAAAPKAKPPASTAPVRHVARLLPEAMQALPVAAASSPAVCNPGLASCRHFMASRNNAARMAARGRARVANAIRPGPGSVRQR
jgi:murein L,D-transpeptidase YafK